jgi:hypothetical protein
MFLFGTGRLLNEMVVTDLENNNETGNIAIFQIPATNELTVNGFTESFTYSITDYAGREIFNGIISNNNIDINDLESDAYFLRISNGTLTKTIKISKF